MKSQPTPAVLCHPQPIASYSAACRQQHSLSNGVTGACAAVSHRGRCTQGSPEKGWKRKRRGRVPQECTDCVCQPRLEREREPTLGTLGYLLFVQLLLNTPRIHPPASLSEKTSAWSPLFDSSPWWLACNSACLQDKGDIPWGSLAADHCHSLPKLCLSFVCPAAVCVI